MARSMRWYIDSCLLRTLIVRSLSCCTYCSNVSKEHIDIYLRDRKAFDLTHLIEKSPRLIAH